MDGIEQLRAKRGAEQITFADIADYLHNYVDRHPRARDTIRRLAQFLAAVEDAPHDHNAGPSRGVSGTLEQELPPV